MNTKFHIGMALIVVGALLFIFAEEAVETATSNGSEVEYDYTDRQLMESYREREY